MCNKDSENAVFYLEFVCLWILFSWQKEEVDGTADAKITAAVFGDYLLLLSILLLRGVSSGSVTIFSGQYESGKLSATDLFLCNNQHSFALKCRGLVFLNTRFWVEHSY